MLSWRTKKRKEKSWNVIVFVLKAFGEAIIITSACQRRGSLIVILLSFKKRKWQNASSCQLESSFNKRPDVNIFTVSLLRPDLPHPPVLLSPAGCRAAFPLQPPQSLLSAGYRGTFTMLYPFPTVHHWFPLHAQNIPVLPLFWKTQHF